MTRPPVTVGTHEDDIALSLNPSDPIGNLIGAMAGNPELWARLQRAVEAKRDFHSHRGTDPLYRRMLLAEVSEHQDACLRWSDDLEAAMTVRLDAQGARDLQDALHDAVADLHGQALHRAGMDDDYEPGDGQ